ncbi:MAG: c-type cytochrome [Pseudomonadota bacterium]
MSVSKTFAVLLGCGMILGTAQLPAAPTATMLADTCAGCHGTDGSSAGPATPTIAGVSAEYFKTTMEEYKKDDRKSTIMGRIAKGYSDKEIKLMADHFAAQKIVRVKQDLDAEKVEAGSKLYGKNCEKCHDKSGSLADDDSGILAGQWLTYLTYSMEDFKADKREMPKKMRKKVEKLDDFDIEALLQYFASQQ